MRRLLPFGLAAALFFGSPCVEAAPQKAASHAERRETAERFIHEAVLSRSDFLAVLMPIEGDALDPDLAEPLFDAVYTIYAREVGAAIEEALNQLFREEAGEITLPRLESGQLTAIARATAERMRAATESAAQEAAQGAATGDRTPEAIMSDLLRRRAAKKYQASLTGYGDDDDPGYDTLADYQAARFFHPVIARAAMRANADLSARAALEAAVDEYRREGLAIGRAVIEQGGMSMAATRAYWGGPDRPTEDMSRMIEATQQDAARWAEINERLGAAIEGFLALGAGPDGEDAHAAPHWRLRHLRATAQQAAMLYSWAEMTADTAMLLGVSDEEQVFMRAELDRSLVERVARVKAVVAAYKAWQRSLGRSRGPRHMAEPSEALLKAHERQRAFDQVTRERVIGVIASQRMRDHLRTMSDPALISPRPGWLFHHHQRMKALELRQRREPERASP